MSRRPDAADLLHTARHTLQEALLPALPPALRYQALMVLNALAIAARELADPAPPPDLAEEARLAQAIRAGALDDDDDGETSATVTTLQQLVEAKLRVSNPRLLG